MPLSDNLINAWRFNESGGTITVDEIAGNSGTLDTGVSLGGGVATFTGVSGITLANRVDIFGSFTICLRGQQTDTSSGSSGEGFFFSGKDNNPPNYPFRSDCLVDPFFGQFSTSFGGAGYLTSSLTVGSSMHDWAIVYDSGVPNYKLYQDGSLVDTKSVTFNITDLFIDQIGLYNFTGTVNTMTGAIDYFYVWDRALSPSEISQVASSPDSALPNPLVITPSTVPANHNGNIVLNLTGNGTAWNSGTVFTTSGAGVTKVSQNIIGSGLATLIVSDNNNIGLCTITESGTSHNNTIVVASGLLTILNPTSCSHGKTPRVRFQGTNTIWTQENPSGLFIVTGGTGSSISPLTIIDDNNCSGILTVGSSNATLTITDTSYSGTANFTVANASLSMNQTTGNASVQTILTVSGVNTIWTQETPAGLFSASAGSIGTTPIIDTDAQARFFYTPPSTTNSNTITDNSTTATTTYTSYSVPKWHSNSGAPIKVFLNFAGGSGQFNNLTIHQMTPFTNIASTADLFEIWQTIAEKYVIFSGIDITTEYQGPPTHGSIAWANLGGLYTDWYNNPATGVSPIGLFNSSDHSCSSFIFTDTAFGYIPWCGNAAAHEVGHLFNLAHQGIINGNTVVTEYYEGHDDWCPIMGNSIINFGTVMRVTWWNGSGVLNGDILGPQDDIQTIINYLGIRLVADDVGDTTNTATPFVTNNNIFNTSGLINYHTDVDIWSFTATSGLCALVLTPAVLEPTFDAIIDLLDASGNVIQTDSPVAPNYGASITRTLSAGNYYLKVRNSGDYGDVGRYFLSGIIPFTNFFYTMTGPNHGTNKTTSSYFSLNSNTAGFTATPSTNSAGIFYPSTITINQANQDYHFTYTPLTTNPRTHAINITNTSGLVDPSTINYQVFDKVGQLYGMKR